MQRHPLSRVSMPAGPLLLLLLLLLLVSGRGTTGAWGAAAGAEHESPIARLEEMVRSSLGEKLPPSAWEVMRFLPDPQRLEELLTEAKQEWWCIAFVNTSSSSAQERSVEFIKETLLHASAMLQQEQQKQQEESPPKDPLAARVAVMDLGEASTYFDLYPFAHVFGSDDGAGDVAASARSEVLANVERMVRDGRVLHATRKDLEAPVLLLFRPGAVAYLREGRQWTARQLEQLEQQENQKPLRMMVHASQMQHFIQEVPQRTVTALQSLAQHLLSDYKQTAAKRAVTEKTDASNDNNHDLDEKEPDLGILSEDEARRHQSQVLSALHRIREHQKARHEHPPQSPYGIDSLKGSTVQERAQELLRRIRASNDKHDEVDNGGADKERNAEEAEAAASPAEDTAVGGDL